MHLSHYEPFTHKENDKWSGLDIEVINAVANEANCQVNFVEVNWARGVKLLNEGQVDLGLNLSFTEERTKNLLLIGPYRTEDMILVVNRDSNYDITNVADLVKLPHSVGIQHSTFYGPLTEKMENDRRFAKRFTITNLLAQEQRISMLNKDRISAYVDVKLHVMHLIKYDPLFSEVKIHPFKISQNDIYIGINRKSVPESIQNRLQASMDKLRSQGIFKDMEEKYRELLK